VVGEEVIEEVGKLEEPVAPVEEAEDAAEEPVVPVDPVVELDSELVVDIIAVEVIEVIVVDIMEAEVPVPEESAVVGRGVGPIMHEDMHIS
jgi:hypothetical protein